MWTVSKSGKDGIKLGMDRIQNKGSGIDMSPSYILRDDKASPVTTFMRKAAHMAAAMSLVVTNFVFVFSHRVSLLDLGLNCVIS